MSQHTVVECYKCGLPILPWQIVWMRIVSGARVPLHPRCYEELPVMDEKP